LSETFCLARGYYRGVTEDANTHPDRPPAEAEIARHLTTGNIVAICPQSYDIKIYFKSEIDSAHMAMSGFLWADIPGIIAERISEKCVLQPDAARGPVVILQVIAGITTASLYE